MKKLIAGASIIFMFTVTGCASMEHTGMSIGGAVQVFPGVTIDTRQYFKKKKN